MLLLGNASGHDFQFHIASWMDAAGQWREGILYPRWAEWANWGFGEPRFVFYPPASWMMGAALGSVLPWRVAPGAFIWLALVVSGMSMWRLSREWLSPRQSIAAALLFAASPYTLVIVYYRSDFAELLADALMPLLVWAALRVAHEGWRKVPALAVIFASIWLSNAPAAVIATYSLGVMLLVTSAARRSPRPLLQGSAAMGAGFCLAGCYILPAVYEQRWIQIAQAVADNLQASQNFLFTRQGDPAFVIFNWKVSWVALGTIVALCVAMIVAVRKRKESQDIWWVLAALGAVSVALMFSPANFLWRTLPELKFIQFPWRWLGMLDVVAAFFVAAAIGRAQKRWAWWLALVIVLAAIGASATTMVKNAWWDNEDVPSMANSIRSGRGYQGADEYAPADTDRYQLPGDPDDDDRLDGVSADPAPAIGKFDPASGALSPATGVNIQIEKWTAERRAFAAETGKPITLALRLVDYPAWDTTIDGKEIRPSLAPQTAQVLLPFAPGTHTIAMRFRRTWDRTAGDGISALAAIALLGFGLGFRRRDAAREDR